MTQQELIQEFTEFVNTHDLDEEEYEALKSWVKEGNSPYTNPDHYCVSGREISFMKWHWILADPLHPYHHSLITHRHHLEEGTEAMYRSQKQMKEKADTFLAMDYQDSIIHPQQALFMGPGTYSSAAETKEYLLTEMEYTKKAFQKMLELEKEVEIWLGDLDLTGNLFLDVKNVRKLLDFAEMRADEFMYACYLAWQHEDEFRASCIGSPVQEKEEDLPF